MQGRDCINDVGGRVCGYRTTLKAEDALRLGEIKHHSKPEPEDGQRVIDVMKRYAITLPANAIEWRVWNGRKGSHPLFNTPIALLLTDGVVAWYLLDSGVPFFGHLSNFTEDEPEESEEKAAPRIAQKIHKRNIKLADAD